MDTRTVITEIYTAFNDRDVEKIFALMADDVSWPRASEGGRVVGKDEICAYWTRQWSEFDPKVYPQEITNQGEGKTLVHVHQVVKSVAGELLSDSIVWHLYTISDGLIERMEIVEDQGAATDGPSAAFAVPAE